MNPPLRVVHVSKVKGIAGSEGHLLRLLPGLAALGVDVRMIVLVEPRGDDRGFSDALAHRGIAVERLTLRHDVDPFIGLALVRRFRALRPDLVHTHLVHADAYGLWAARRAGVPSALSSRHNNDRFRRRTACRWLTRWSMSHADAVVAISGAVADFTIRVEGVASSRVVTVHYGLEADAPGPADMAAARLRLGAPTGEPLVGVIGRSVEQKGIDVLLSAFPRIIAAVPDARLAVVGDGPLRGALEATAQALGIAGRVRFTGWVDRASTLMPACDVVVIPSRFEGFGLVALEAMAASRPIVATRVDALCEIVADGETGLLVPGEDPERLAEVVAGLLRAPDRAQAMGRAGHRRLVERFSVDRMVDGTLAVYQRVLTGGRAAADTGAAQAAW